MSKSEIQVLDFEKICRLCLLEKRSMSAIFSKKKSDKKVPLPVRIMSCASLELYEGDGLPASICNKCLMSVNQSYAFREQCEQADTTLRQYAQRLNEANEEASTKNGEKNENQKTTTIGPSENKNDIIDEGLPTEVPDEKSNVGSLNAEVSLSLVNEEPNTKRKNLTEKRKTNVRKKRPKGIYMDDDEWFDDSSLHSADDLERTDEVGAGKPGKNFDDSGKTSELGKFLHFYRPDNDDLRMEVKNEPQESEQASISAQTDGKLADENFDETVEEIRALYHEKLGEVNVKKSKKEEKPKKSEGEPCLYRCEHCPKVYPSQGGLSYHRFIYHSAKYTPPVCDICGKTFRIQKYLESHKNTVHFKLKDHLCDLCGKDFSSKYGLKLHKIWHMGTKNFPCDVCGMRFSTIGKVNTHKQVHGGPKNYICEVCSRAFRWKKSLFTHMRTHSGERPYKCEHCDRTFSALWNMQQHVRIHTGERPYKCDVCGKAFALNASMKEHRNRHHKT